MNKCKKFFRCGNTKLPNHNYCIPCQKEAASWRRQNKERQNSKSISQADKEFIKKTNFHLVNKTNNNQFYPTQKWISANTHNNAMTTAQHIALGMFETPPCGWIQRVTNKRIPINNKKAFEIAIHIKSKTLRKLLKTGQLPNDTFLAKIVTEYAALIPEQILAYTKYQNSFYTKKKVNKINRLKETLLS